MKMDIWSPLGLDTTKGLEPKYKQYPQKKKKIQSINKKIHQKNQPLAKGIFYPIREPVDSQLQRYSRDEKPC